MKIRKYKESDWEQLWPIIEKVFRTGETYPYSPNITEKEAYSKWIEAPQEIYVCTEVCIEDGTKNNNEILGTYFIKPNQPELGAHVCNCGYIVSENTRGKGVATRLCEHSQQVAIDLDFRAMQYNLVVSTNAAAVHLWKKLGFDIIGTLPKAFKSKSLGYVDALLMYKELVE